MAPEFEVILPLSFTYEYATINASIDEIKNASGRLLPATSTPKPKIEKILAPIMVPTPIATASKRLSFFELPEVFIIKKETTLVLNIFQWQKNYLLKN